MELNILYALMIYLSGIKCFNVDVDNVVNIQEASESHFGYSALMFINNGQKWVVVGAPKANFTTPNPYKSPGNVYKCRLNFTSRQQEQCTAMNLEQTDSFRWPDVFIISPGYEEDNELLGASMAMIGDTIIVCAPLWKNYIPWRSEHIVHPYGRCFNVDSTLNSYSSTPFKSSPLRKSTNWTITSSQFFYEFAQIGFSISSKKYEHSSHGVLLGAPGFFENEGGFVQYNDKSTNADVDLINSFTRIAFKDQRPLHFGDFLGYSITTGNVVNNSDCTNVVIFGAPHYINIDGIGGSVFVVCAYKDSRERMKLMKQFFGKKSGGGFGTSLVFEDFNNDGLDDLLVGEPLYFDTKTNVLDVGAVHIYYGINDSSVLLEESRQVLYGSEKENGRFGTSMECVGDINKDTYNDIAIAAPYEDELKGALYIYHGGESGLTLSQRITPEDIGMDLQSFGWYISTAYDIDGNQYPDFLVGSYMSDTVSVFRTRPIVILRSTIEAIPEVIPLNSTGLPCQDKFFRPCVSVQICFSYDGEFVPAKIRMYYNLSVDVGRTRTIPIRTSRLGLINNREGNATFIEGFIDISLENGSCVIHNAVVQTLDRDFYASLEEQLVFETGFELSTISIQGEVQPILQTNTVTLKQASANFSTGCNDTCHPDLHIDTKQDADVIFLGDVSEIVLKVHISNRGDQAYGTQLFIDYSNNTNYNGFSQPQDEDTEYVICEETNDRNNDTRVECNMPTTFYKTQMVAITVRFAVLRSLLIKDNQSLENFSQDIIIQSAVQSTTLDDNVGDNIDTSSVKVKLKSFVELSGISNPEELQLSNKGSKGIVFTHSYNIFNHGPSPLNDYSFYICLPVIREEGTRLIVKEDVKVITTNKHLTWKILNYPEEPQETSTTQNQHSTETTSPIEMYITSGEETSSPIEINITVAEEMTFPMEMNITSAEETTSPIVMNITSAGEMTDLVKDEIITATTLPYDTSTNNDGQETSTMQTPEQDEKIIETRGKLKFNVITCEGKPKNRLAILEFFVSVLEKNKGILFELPFNLSESVLDFGEVSGVIYKTRGALPSRNDERYVTTPYNATFEAVYVTTEIYGREILAVVTAKISIWIIIGASVGGFVLLISFGVLLKKCGFFERKKREDVKKFKRQTGYYAKKQSRISMMSTKVKTVSSETLNDDFTSYGKEEHKLGTITE